MYGTDIVPKGKAATANYTLFETDSIKKMADYINTHAVVPCELKPLTKQQHTKDRAKVVVEGSGYRLKDNVGQIYNWIRLDLDKKGEAKKIDKALKKVEHIKKPSTNNSDYPYKWHYFIPIKNVAQTPDEYKLQYFAFLAEHDIELSDKSLASVVQNTNPYKGNKKEANTLTTYRKGKCWVAPKVKAPKKPDRVKKENTSDISKADVKKALSKLDPNMPYRNESEDGSPTWMSVALSIISWNDGDDGFKVFNKWSKKGDSYDKVEVRHHWDKWVNEGSKDTTIGTLIHMAYGEKLPEPTSLFKKEVGTVQPPKPLTKKEKKKAEKEAEKKRENFNILNIEGVMDDDELARQANEVVLFDGLIAEGYHTVLYGAAGSNKTTISAWACVDMLKKFPNKAVQYWAFDSDRIHNNEIYSYTKRQGVKERFLLITQKDSEYFKQYYDEIISNEYDLRDLVIVIDTYKFITSDVNSKSANKTVLHEIKKLQQLGASILTLSHANKDGANFSGTGELSQDTDALLVISREKDDNTGDITTTIKTDTRARFGVPVGGITLMSNGNDVTGAEFHEKIFNNLKRIENRFDSNEDMATEIFEKEKDVGKKKKLKEIEDRKEIKELQRIIKYLHKGDHTNPIESAILAEGRRTGLTVTKIQNLLREYDEVYWVYKDVKQRNSPHPVKRYKLIN